MKKEKFKWKYAVGIPLVTLLAGIVGGKTYLNYTNTLPEKQPTSIVKPAETRLTQGDLEAIAETSPNKITKDSGYRISNRGLDLIKESEGFSNSVYICPAGKNTIGYGHLVKEDENYKTISKQEAERLLLKDVQNAEEVVKKLVNVPINPSQYDALVSFVYNFGEGNLKKSTLLKKLNSKDYQGASNEFERWVYADSKKLKGLEKRRTAEKNLFLSED